jgi:hypothetical protein
LFSFAGVVASSKTLTVLNWGVFAATTPSMLSDYIIGANGDSLAKRLLVRSLYRPNPVEVSSAGYAAIAHNDDTFESRCCSQATSEYSDSSAALSMPDSRAFSCDHSIPPGDLA